MHNGAVHLSTSFSVAAFTKQESGSRLLASSPTRRRTRRPTRRTTPKKLFRTTFFSRLKQIIAPGVVSIVSDIDNRLTFLNHEISVLNSRYCLGSGQPTIRSSLCPLLGGSCNLQKFHGNEFYANGCDE